MKRGIFFILLVIAMIIAFICSLMPMPGATEPAEKAHADDSRKTNTTQASYEEKTTSTTRAPPVEIDTPPECVVNADCGITYAASCHCDGDTLYVTNYIPLCVGGSCIWKSKTGELFCRGREYESSDNSTGQRCVNGFGRCIKNSEVERYLVLHPNVSVINGTVRDAYPDEDHSHDESLEEEYIADRNYLFQDAPSNTYKEYTFTYNRTGFYSPESMCQENQYYVMDYASGTNGRGQLILSWNGSKRVGNIVVKVGGVASDGERITDVVLWVRKAKKNDNGFF